MQFKQKKISKNDTTKKEKENYKYTKNLQTLNLN